MKPEPNRPLLPDRSSSSCEKLGLVGDLGTFHARRMAVTTVVFPTLDGRNPDAEGTVDSWLAEEGEWVRAGTLIAEVSVGRASGQVAAPVDGVLRQQTAGGERVRQGAVVGVLE